MIDEHANAWKAFKDAGLLWWVNRILHLFGWSIVLNVDIATFKVLDAYPMRTTWKGFTPEAEEMGFKHLQQYMTTLKFEDIPDTGEQTDGTGKMKMDIHERKQS